MGKDDVRQNIESFKSIGELMACVAPKRLSRVKQRLIEGSTEISQSAAEQITYQHTVLCQTGYPTAIPAQTCGVGSAKMATPILRSKPGE